MTWHLELEVWLNIKDFLWILFFVKNENENRTKRKMQMIMYFFFILNNKCVYNLGPLWRFCLPDKNMK